MSRGRQLTKLVNTAGVQLQAEGEAGVKQGVNSVGKVNVRQWVTEPSPTLCWEGKSAGKEEQNGTVRVRRKQRTRRRKLM